MHESRQQETWAQEQQSKERGAPLPHSLMAGRLKGKLKSLNQDHTTANISSLIATMPKKGWGVNEKVQEARDRKQQEKQQSRAKEAKAKEDAYWAQHENPRTRKDAKREEEERKREEAAARKAELRRLAAEEEAALAAAGKKKAPQKVGAAKVTSHQLQLSKEQEQKEEERLAKERADAAKRMVSEENYAAAIEVENINRQEGVVEARSVDAALAALSVGDAAADKHPEKRAKAAWEAYYAAELPRLKESKPGLRLMQYKSMIFDSWQRHPQNPRNQPRELGGSSSK